MILSDMFYPLSDALINYAGLNIRWSRGLGKALKGLFKALMRPPKRPFETTLC